MRVMAFFGRMFPFVGVAFAVVLLAVWIPFWMSCSLGTGACVGSGGTILLSPVCKQGWSQSECADWNSQGVDDASWNFHSGQSCSDAGYPAKCSDGSYRQSSSDC